MARDGGPVDDGVNRFAGLLAEVVDLKRVEAAGHEGSLATRRFLGAWSALAAGTPLRQVAVTEAAAAVVAARLGGIDAEVLAQAGLDADATDGILGRAFDEQADALATSGGPDHSNSPGHRSGAGLARSEAGLVAELRAAALRAPGAGDLLDGDTAAGRAETPADGDAAAEEAVTTGEGPRLEPEADAADEPGADPDHRAAGDPHGGPPPFAIALARQPRAGATAPGRGRLLLTPTESHGDHCWVVAVGAVLSAAVRGADPELPFLCGMAHHLHNATLPDSGFAGEMLLGEHLDTVLANLRDQALEQLPLDLADRVRFALRLLDDADSPEAQSFHEADVLDRVLEMRWHATTAGFTLDQALDELDLVHEGPLQAFGLEVVERAGLRA